MSDPQDKLSVAPRAISATDQVDEPLATDCHSPASESRADVDRSLALESGKAGLRAGREARGRPAIPLVAPAASHVRLLRRLILDEVVVKVLGLPASGWPRRPFEWLLRIPAQRFAQLGAGFDLHLARGGFAEAARWVLPRFVSDWRAYGTEHIPLGGPLLVVSNHPGAYDVLVVAANLPRDDLKVVAGNISFLQSFSAADRGLIFAGRDLHTRATALRAAIRHLDAGRALLIFPSDTIDPDPEIAPVGPDELARWSSSIEWILRRVPKTAVLVTIVSGVVARACYHHPLTLLRREAADRRRVAELIQIAGQLLLGRTVSLVPKVSFAAPVTVPGLGTREDVTSAMRAIIARAQRTMEHHLL